VGTFNPNVYIDTSRNTGHVTRTPCSIIFPFIYYLFILWTPIINGVTKHLLIKIPIQLRMFTIDDFRTS
jgi:hypothetical protein